MTRYGRKGTEDINNTETAPVRTLPYCRLRLQGRVLIADEKALLPASGSVHL